PDRDDEEVQSKLIAALKKDPPWGVRVDVTPESTGGWWYTDANAPAFRAARKALRDGYEKAPVSIGCGGSVPFADPFSRELGGAPAPLLGARDPYSNAHSAYASLHRGVLGLIQRAFAGETVTVPPVWYDPRQLTQVRIEKGNRVGMSATFFPLFAPGGKVSHVGIVFKDLTAEMVQREQLEEERELLSAIIDQVSEGITMCDERGTLRIVNRAARQLGVRAGTPMEKWATAFPPDWPNPDQFPMSRALRGETTRAIIKRDGRALSVVAVPLRRSDGSLRGAVSTFRDETDRVRHEQEAEQAAHFRER